MKSVAQVVASSKPKTPGKRTPTWVALCIAGWVSFPHCSCFCWSIHKSEANMQRPCSYCKRNVIETDRQVLRREPEIAPAAAKAPRAVIIKGHAHESVGVSQWCCSDGTDGLRTIGRHLRSCPLRSCSHLGMALLLRSIGQFRCRKRSGTLVLMTLTGKSQMLSGSMSSGGWSKGARCVK